MCKGCEIRTRHMVDASAKLDALRSFARDVLANGHDDGHAAALDEMLPKLDALAVQLAGPTLRAPPAPPVTEPGTGTQQGPDGAPAPPEPAPVTPPAPTGFTHAARVAAAMER